MLWLGQGSYWGLTEHKLQIQLQTPVNKMIMLTWATNTPTDTDKEDDNKVNMDCIY